MMAAADEPPPYAMVAGAVPAHTTAPGVACRVVAPTGALPPPALTARDADLLRSWKFFTNEFQRRNLFFQIDNPRKLGTSEVKLCCNNHFTTVLAECLRLVNVSCAYLFMFICMSISEWTISTCLHHLSVHLCVLVVVRNRRGCIQLPRRKSFLPVPQQLVLPTAGAVGVDAAHVSTSCFPPNCAN